MEEKTLKKILICSYIIIGLLILNTIILICKGNISTPNLDETTTENNTEYDVSMMESVDLDKMLNDVFKREDIQVVYMGRSTCSHCVSFLPILQKAQEEYDYETLYLDISTVDSDGQSKIVNLDEEFFNENYGATPTVLLFKDNKIVDSHIGYSEYDDYASFLEKNGFSKK